MKKNRDTDQMALSGTEEAEILSRLGERVEKAVSTIQELRRENEKLRARVEEMESRMREQDDAGARLESIGDEHHRITKARGEIRGRIESILGSLEALEAE